MDTVLGADVHNLQGKDLPAVGNGNPEANVIIDWTGEFNNRLYVCNNGGCARSDLAGHPGDGGTTDCVDCTPSSGDFTAKASITTAKVSDIEPADKAFPYLTEYKGRLYAGRNTTTGPQMWVCNPASSGAATDCDPDDWTLIASNSIGDTKLTQFNNANNEHIALVAATANTLWVGFNNATDGVAIFKTTAANPTARGDFEGQDGCSADGWLARHHSTQTL